MIRIDQASLRRGKILLFEDVSLQAHAGQRLGLTGLNGCGKSSLFALLLGELETDSGEVYINPSDRIAHVAQESPSTTRPAIEYVIDGDAELRVTLDEITALEQGGDPSAMQPLVARMEEIDGYTAHTRAGRLMHGLGFSTEDSARPVRSFSGGWRMRLNLAQALMCRSDILLLDEPTNHLDLPAILWLERWLKAYPGVLILISHDRDFLDALCTHIAQIEHQRLTVYTGNYSQFEATRAERLALQQSMHQRQQKDIKHIQSYVDRFRYKASKARQAQSRLKMLERMTLIAPAHVDSGFRFEFRKPERQPQQLLSLDRAIAGYDQPVLSNIRLDIQAGDRIGLLGVNGAGKSTLVKALADGSTLLDGERLQHQHARIGYFAQHQLDQLSMDSSPLWHVRRGDPQLTDQAARDFLGRFGFRGERVEEPVAPFSGGEKSRLVLALMILGKPNLLLLDEPTNHLDLEMRQALSMALTGYSGALVLISHDRHLLRSVCDDLFIVHDGQVEHFDDDLDHYPAWLRDRQSPRQETQAPEQSRGELRKARRQADAARRKALKPLLDRVRSVEKEMNALRMELELLESQLGDENLYSDPERQQELADKVRTQGKLRKSIADCEWQWLEASEALEKAEQQPEDGT
jgi:ATP-binding cassette subfamily F protein 3